MLFGLCEHRQNFLQGRMPFRGKYLRRIDKKVHQGRSMPGVSSSWRKFVAVSGLRLFDEGQEVLSSHGIIKKFVISFGLEKRLIHAQQIGAVIA